MAFVLGLFVGVSVTVLGLGYINYKFPAALDKTLTAMRKG